MVGLVAISGCASVGAQDPLAAVQVLKGKPLTVAQAVFGAPDVSTTVRPRTASSWVKVETEYYAAPSMQRQMSGDGNAVLSEAQGLKLKQHEITCIIRIESDATRRISLVKLLGNRRACGLYLQKVTLPARFS